MSSAMVFVFLLDNLSGYNKTLTESLNATLHTQSNAINIQQCDRLMTNEILDAISRQIHLNLKPVRGHGQQFTDIYTPISLENRHPDFDNSIASDNQGSFDGDINLNQLNNGVNSRNEDSDCAMEVVANEETSKNVSEVRFPENAPFMVAIFETLLNVTAQTCAGTLVASQWVLTAACCINLLGNANDTHKSHYTIVAGSTNPLSGGTAHNVTSILLHPDVTVAAQGPTFKDPFLALMKIEPEVVGEPAQVVGGTFESREVMVYGWILIKNEGESDTVKFTAASAAVLSRAECRNLYNYQNNDIICLSNKDPDKNASLLSTGGPVLVMHNNKVKLLGIAQTDEHLFIAYSLAAHYKWIKTVLRN